MCGRTIETVHVGFILNSILIMDVINHNMVRSAKVLVLSCTENGDSFSCHSTKVGAVVEPSIPLREVG